MSSKVYPAMCLLAALVIVVWPGIHAHGWDAAPTVADLLACMFTILGIVVWEIRDVYKRVEELTDRSWVE